MIILYPIRCYNAVCMRYALMYCSQARMLLLVDFKTTVKSDYPVQILEKL